jgi:hypothetical protein
MCIIKPIEAAEYNGKLYRSAKEAATFALQEVGAAIVQHGGANAGVKLLENADTLRKLFDILRPAAAPVTPPPPADEDDSDTTFIDGRFTRADTPYNRRMAVYAVLKENMAGAPGLVNHTIRVLAASGMADIEVFRKHADDGEVEVIGKKLSVL